MSHIPAILNANRKWLMARLVANGMCQALAMIATAWLIKLIFDGFITHSEPTASGSLAWYAAGLFAAAISIALLRMWERIDAEKLGQDYTHDVRTGLFRHMGRLSPRVLQRRSRGGVALRFIGDLTSLKQWVSLGLARLTVATITTVLTLCMLAVVSGPLALIVGISLAAGAAAAYGLGRWLQSAVREVRRRRARLAANVSEKIGSLAVMQVFGQSQREERRVRRQSLQLKDAMVQRARAVGAFRAATELTAAAASSGALLLGAGLVMAGETTPGTVVAAMSIVGLLVPSLRDLGRVQEYWHGAIVSREKIEDFLAMPVLVSTREESPELIEGDGKLEFSNISVPGSLDNFSAVAEPGQIIAIVGPNGAGKSTLLSLTARLMDPEQGAIYLDDQNIKTIDTASLRRAVGVMTPDLPLLRGSVDRNLRYRVPDAPEQEVARVRTLCGINEILDELPAGAATRITEDGANLSVGQRQRIGLARAILGNPGILLLDEVDANLDPKSATALQRVLASHGGTVLLVTHRLDWVKQADVVWHLQGGSLVEAGSPAELLKNDGATTRLFEHSRIAI